jgi:hypothetical protein
LPLTTPIQQGSASPTPAFCTLRRKNFAGKEWIKVPKIDWEHTTSEVLTMEYCPGIKINRAQQLDAAVRPQGCLPARYIIFSPSGLGSPCIAAAYVVRDKVSGMQGIDRKRLAKLSVESYLEQLLTYGFFHAGVNLQPARPADGFAPSHH